MAETSNLKNQFGEVKNRVGQTATNVPEDVKDRASQAATGVMDKARETVGAAGERADSAVSSVGSAISSMAGTIRDKLPHEGMIGRTGERVAGTLETGGR